MSDLHSINEAINKRAGRKLLPSIGVSLFLISLVWFSLASYRVIFAGLVSKTTPIGVLGFLFALTGVLTLVRSISAITSGAIKGATRPKGSRSSFSDRMQERWDRRNFEQ